MFADYRDDFSLLDKIKQVFPEIIRANRAHPQFVVGCRSAEEASARPGIFTAPAFHRHFEVTPRLCAPRYTPHPAASTSQVFDKVSLVSLPENGEPLLIRPDGSVESNARLKRAFSPLLVWVHVFPWALPKAGHEEAPLALKRYGRACFLFVMH